MDIISHANADHFVVYDYCNQCGQMQEEENLIDDICGGCYKHNMD